MKKSVWLSYDLGVKGDYESLYQWLDSHGAIECGDSVAYLQYEWQKSNDSLPDIIKQNLSKSVRFKRFDRVYMIWKEEDKIKGKFLIGNRKAAPWAGYSGTPSGIDEE